MVKKTTIKPSLTSNPLDITLYYYFMTTKAALPQNNDRRSYRDGTPKILISHIIYNIYVSAALRPISTKLACAIATCVIYNNNY